MSDFPKSRLTAIVLDAVNSARESGGEVTSLDLTLDEAQLDSLRLSTAILYVEEHLPHPFDDETLQRFGSAKRLSDIVDILCDRYDRAA